MEGKGIIRRLDDLGRIVIPKEYRRMFKIELGDPLEIFAVEDGRIIVKKLDMSLTVKNEATAAAEALECELGKTVMVTDKERFISGAGLNKHNLLDVKLTGGIKSALKNFKTLNTTTVNDSLDINLGESGYDYFALAPILNNGIGYGSLVILSADPVSKEELRIIKIAAQLVALNLQRY